MNLISMMYERAPRWLKKVADVVVKKVTDNHHKARFFAVPGVTEYSIGWMTNRGFRVQCIAKPMVDEKISKKFKGIDIIPGLQRGPVPYEEYADLIKALIGSPYVFASIPEWVNPNGTSSFPHNGEVTIRLTDVDERTSYIVTVGDCRLASDIYRAKALAENGHQRMGLYDYPR